MVKFAEERGVILRPRKKRYGSDGFFRVTAGTEEENRMFVDLAKEFFCS